MLSQLLRNAGGWDRFCAAIPDRHDRYKAMSSSLLTEAAKLCVSERIDLVAAIWDSLAAEINTLPLSEDHRPELDRRLTDLEINPEAGEEWSEVRARLERGL